MNRYNKKVSTGVPIKANSMLAATSLFILFAITFRITSVPKYKHLNDTLG